MPVDNVPVEGSEDAVVIPVSKRTGGYHCDECRRVISRGEWEENLGLCERCGSSDNDESL